MILLGHAKQQQGDAQLKSVSLPLLLPSITLNTAPDNHHPIRQVQLQRWDGKSWQHFGGILSSS